MDHSKLRRLIRVLRDLLVWMIALLFIAAGINHFISPNFYVQMIPDGWPRPLMLVHVSGVLEVIGGVGLLVPPLRRFAGWGLIALLIAVFPANVHMALHPDRYDDFSHTGLIARLPLQGVLIALVWWGACRSGNQGGQ
ncbi:DoxX family protein [Rhodopirellula sp. P2]|uniref:DoxX family protein n=1 Tax=Rhodopirellula sp. P2 TaxID=2127060 RepID=UPI0023689C30|nr:DoxX family membrane protein [Rhodopirellula sp. P2]WDQ17274.1 DoxX family protein [Rhodopirellula sp. P2]